jgi:hypothetical protein
MLERPTVHPDACHATGETGDHRNANVTTAALLRGGDAGVRGGGRVRKEVRWTTKKSVGGIGILLNPTTTAISALTTRARTEGGSIGGAPSAALSLSKIINDSQVFSTGGCEVPVAPILTGGKSHEGRTFAGIKLGETIEGGGGSARRHD